MRYGIIADIHGNKHALEAVFEHMDTVTKPDQVVCAGDLVNYGAFNNEVIAMVRERCTHVVKGNHDAACVDLNYNTDLWNYNALLSLAITQKQLTIDNAYYLQSLPTFASIEDVRIVHGVPPNDFEEYSHRISENKLFHQLKKIPEFISFVGHSHHLAHRTFDSSGRCVAEVIIPNTVYSLDPDLRTIVNVGSVGQPDRDHVGDLGAKYVLYDTEKAVYTAYSIQYDTLRAARAMLRCGYPNNNAERIVKTEQYVLIHSRIRYYIYILTTKLPLYFVRK